MTTNQNMIMLGIDTGGTYTDAVLLSRSKGVLHKAKSLTTRRDLSIGISGAVDEVLSNKAIDPGQIELVSISTTLATNALVEGKGGNIALVMIGFDEADVEKAGLGESLRGDPVIFIPGGHDVHGNEQPLDLEPLPAFIETVKGQVSGFAVAGLFAVRNRSHEARVQDYLIERTGLPVTCSHELSSKLGGPKRALTTVLNARLIPVIHDLIRSCRKHLEKIEVDAPLMVVRGDGTLVDADFALNRPIETILSGPAASLIGAQYLLGSQDAVVSDIGGTTTDVAILEDGWPRIEPEGAKVGGFKTMVEAVAMHTFGLGGDSVVAIDDVNPTKLELGPRRQVPVSLLATEFPDVVFAALKRQSKIEYPGPNCTRFAMRNGGREATGLKLTEEKLYSRLMDVPQPLDEFLRGAADANTLTALVSRGLAIVSGVTPSDAMHVLGQQENWDPDAAQLALAIFCRMRDRFGQPVATSAEALATNIQQQLTLQSADVILQTCMTENGIQFGAGGREMIARALDHKPGFVQFSLSLDRPLVGLGASAPCYYPAIGQRLSSETIVPDHADVANAIGAVTSKVRVQQTIEITSADGGHSFNVPTEGKPLRLSDEKTALKEAEQWLRSEVEKLAEAAGASEPVFDVARKVHAVEIEGSRHFVNATITVTAIGDPKISS